ncbi:dihydrodipicolinate synthase family protein [Microbacterium oryzae]|uniref:dihydrodipicolinate synthase family protein n=1 Tax=Microbacterium oryzae TaxID=743009 RepID=UPI0025B03302|nr:dihydrodipicolinate synthase family protein [Microbacterium oryzae]MDN3311399.1 dihydrodipicolinate synthase family protein [Microbacterium oryzae]
MTRRDILTAVPTSFHADGSLDLEGSRSIFRYVAQSGNEGAFVLGTTGEFPAIDDAEFAQLVEAALADLGDAMRVVVHVGAPSAFEAVRRVRAARELGATEFAAVTPYYLPTSDAALLRYYDALSEAVGDGSLYVYVFPARTGNPVSPELLGRIAERSNIVGVKASELSLDEIAAYRAAVPEEFVIYTGADRDLVAAGEVGAQGVVSGVSSVLPKPFRALAAAADSGDPDRVAAAQADVDDIVSVIGGDMPRMKAAYRAMGVADGYCRMALDEPSADALSEIDRVIAAHR